MSSQADEHSRWVTLLVLRRADQAAVAALLALALGTIAVYWGWQAAWRNQLVEIDRAEQRPVHFQLDLNQAGWPELMLLPGIGETLARRIVKSRESDGRFAQHDDLQRVTGIGPRTMERVRPYLLPIDEDAAGPIRD